LNPLRNTVNQFKALLLFSGIFNIVLATPLIFPFLYKQYFQLLWHINVLLSLGGNQPLPPTEGINALLINTAGIDLVLIGVIVIYASLDPINRKFIPIVNAFGRILFASIIIYYCIAYDIARIVLVIGVIDVVISLGFCYYLLKIKQLAKSLSNQSLQPTSLTLGG
jgi:hypothetical protein